MDPTAEPVTANVDGWTVQSSSMQRPTEAELSEALAGTPPPVEPVAPAAAPVDTAVAAPVEEIPPVVGDQPPPAAPPVVPAVNPAVQARIDKSIRAQREAERDRDAAKYRADQLERENATLRAATPPAATPAEERPAVVTPPAATPAPVTESATPEPLWADYETRGESWEDFQKAWRGWNHETTVAAATAAAQATVKERLEVDRKTDVAERHRHDAETRFQTRMDAMRAKNPDYDQLVTANEDALAPLNSAYLEHLIMYTNEGADILLDLVRDPVGAAVLSEQQPTRAVVDAIGLSGAPRLLLKHFAAHPDEMQRLIASNDPRTVFMTLGSLEARLAGARTPASPVTVPATTPRPAPPLRPVAGVSTTAGAVPATDDDAFGPEYVRKQNRADAERRRGL